LESQKTWVFTVGILEWQHADLFGSCPPPRKTAATSNSLNSSAMPASLRNQITYLSDAEATKSRIKQRAPGTPSSGRRKGTCWSSISAPRLSDQETGRTCFANYDAGKKDEAPGKWKASSRQLKTSFRGSRALLLADCCHPAHCSTWLKSGGIPKSPSPRSRPSYSHNTSTAAGPSATAFSLASVEAAGRP